MSKSLVIVQDYVPAYRLAFFEALRETLARSGIDCIVTTGDPTAHAGRGDGSSADWSVPTPTKSIKFGSRRINLGGSLPAWKHADGVILGSQGSSVDVYHAMLRGRFASQSPRVGLWGHIKDYVNKPHPVDQSLEKWQLRHADHIFAYTPGGAQYARQIGAASDRVTTVMNSIDTSELERASAGIDDVRLAAFDALIGVRPGKALAYVGALDRSKRIDFLAASLEHLWQLDPGIKLIVAGNGIDASLLGPAVARSQVLLLGYASAETKALMARVSSALVMPGRIGLVAVDSLVLGLDVITTPYPFHAPEAEYLLEGVNRFTTLDDPISFAEGMSAAVNRHDRARTLSQSMIKIPTLDAMVTNFSEGVVRMLDQPRRAG